MFEYFKFLSMIGNSFKLVLDTGYPACRQCSHLSKKGIYTSLFDVYVLGENIHIQWKHLKVAQSQWHVSSSSHFWGIVDAPTLSPASRRWHLQLPDIQMNCSDLT